MMPEISVLRLNLLRAGYLLLVVGLGSTVWPEIIAPASAWAPLRGVVLCMLGAMSALALLGLRHPLKMLPLLFFEMGWKALWLLRVALPAWASGRLDAATTETAMECSIGAIFLVRRSVALHHQHLREGTGRSLVSKSSLRSDRRTCANIRCKRITTTQPKPARCPISDPHDKLPYNTLAHLPRQVQICSGEMIDDRQI